MRSELKTIILLVLLILVAYTFTSGSLTGYSVWWSNTPSFVINETSHFVAGTTLNTAASEDAIKLENTTPTSYYASGNWTSDSITIGVNKMLKNMTIAYSLNRTKKIDGPNNPYKEYGTTSIFAAPAYPVPDSGSWTGPMAYPYNNLAAPDGAFQSKGVIPAVGATGYVAQLFNFSVDNAVSGNITWKGYGTIAGLSSAITKFYIWDEKSSIYNELWAFSQINTQTTQSLSAEQISDGLKSGRLYFMAVTWGQTVSQTVTVFTDYIQLELIDGTIDRIEWLDPSNNIVAYDDNDVSDGFSVYYDASNIDSGNLSYLNTSTMNVRVFVTGSGGSTPIIDDIIGYYENMPIAPNNPPQITLTSPAAGQTNVRIPAQLTASVSDDDNDVMSVSFYDSSNNLIGTNAGISTGSTTTATWSGLSNGVVYTWYATVTDGTDTTQSDTWSFKTYVYVPSGGGGGIVVTKPKKEITTSTQETYSIVSEDIDVTEGIGITNEGTEAIEVSVKVEDGDLIQIDYENVTIEPGETEIIKIQTSVPEGTEPGEYKGKVRVTANGIEKVINVTTLVKGTEKEPVVEEENPLMILIEYSYEKRIEVYALRIIFSFLNIEFK